MPKTKDSISSSKGKEPSKASSSKARSSKAGSSKITPAGTTSLSLRPAPRRKLQSLPEEILIQIAENVHNWSLLQLRRVSRQLNRISFDTFTRAYFTKRNHVISPWSLRALLNISAHPTLGRYLIHLGINSALLTYDEDKGLTDPIAKQQQIFVRSGEFKRQLTQVLKNLRRHGNSMDLHIQCNYYPVLGYGGGRLFSSEIEEPYWDPFIDTFMADALLIYHDAAKVTNYPISCVILDVSTGDGAWAGGMHNAAKALVEARKDENELIPGGLLECQLTHPHRDSEPAVIYWNCRDKTLKFDNMNPKTGTGPFGFRDFLYLIEWLPRQTITHLDFTDCSTGAREISYLVDFQRNSLRSLYIEDVTLDDGTNWSEVLSELVDCTELSTIRIHGMWSTNGRKRCDCGIIDETIEAHGVENVKRELEVLTARFERIEEKAKEEFLRGQ